MKPILAAMLASFAAYGVDELFFYGQHVDPIMRMLRDVAHGFRCS